MWRAFEWLERELETLDTAVILVAHDRWFLESVTTAVLELSPGGAHYFAGPWHEWRREKAARAAAAKDRGSRLGRHRPSRPLRNPFPLQEVEGPAGAGEAHANRASGEGARCGTRRARRADAPQAHTRVRFPDAGRTGRIVLEAEHITLSAGDKRLLEDATIIIGGARSPSSGITEAGKRRCSKRFSENARSTKAPRRWATVSSPGYFSQHTQELPTEKDPCWTRRRLRRVCRDLRRKRCSGGFSFPAGKCTNVR